MYHNTVNLDDATSTAGTTYGIYSSAATPTGVDIKNNIVWIARGGTGTKYCLYYTGAALSSNYNNLLMTSTAGTNAIGYFAAAFTTLANWKTANAGAWDQNSIGIDPIFTSVATHNLKPTNYYTDNKGVNVGVAQDINNVSRALVPDIGAYEYDYLLPATAIPFRINSTATDSFNTNGGIPSGTPSCAAGNPDDEKFFSVLKPEGRTSMNVVVQGSSNFNAIFEVFTGTNPTNFAVVACVNASSNTANQTESYYLSGLPSTAETYYIRVYDFRAGAGSGAFRIGVYYLRNPTPNNVPCLAVNGSNNTAKIAGYPYITTAYDNGFGGGAKIDTTQTPPEGPNMAYWIGSTAFAPSIAGAPVSSCGSSSPTPKRVWYAFNIPVLGDVDVVLRTGYGLTSKSTILEAMTATVIPCPTLFNVVKCSNTGTLRLTAADLAPYIGQKMYVQLTEDGGTTSGLDYMLSIQAVSPTISASSITTNGFTVNLPAPSNVSKFRIYYRKVGSSGYVFFDAPSTATSVNINNLISNSDYNVWVGYYNTINSSQIFFSDRITVTTAPGCAGTLPAPTVVITPLPNTSCTKALITWPVFPLAATAYKYRLYYRLTSATGYSVIAMNDTFYNATNLALSSTYEYFYKAICVTNVAVSAVSTFYPNCGTPKSGTETPNMNTVTINGVTYSMADFRELVLATEGDIPADGQVHYVDLSTKVKTRFDVNVYPNPANDYAIVEFETEAGSETKIELISVDGRVITSKPVDTKTGVLNPESNKLMVKERLELNQTNNGLYLVRIIENGNTESRQLMIVK